jgi:carbohydrate diacid regulator
MRQMPSPQPTATVAARAWPEPVAGASERSLRNECRRDRDAGLPEPVQARLAEIASSQMACIGIIAQTMIESYMAEIPAYAAITDPALKEDIKWVSASLVRTWLTILATGNPICDEQLAPIRQGARRRVAQAIDLQSLLRAYRVGTRVMWRELLAAPGWNEPEMRGVLGRVAEWALDYADTLATEVASVYLAEAQDAARQREHRRSQFLSVVLAGPTADEDLHPELHDRHVVVITEAAGEPSLAELEETGALLETSAGVTIWTIRHRRVIGVVPVQSGLGRHALRGCLAKVLKSTRTEAVGLGCDAESPAETRESYAEATAAVELGRALGTGEAGLYDYLDIGPAAVLLNQPGQSRRLMASALAPFESVLRHPWGAETLEAFLTCQGRLNEMANRLGIHPSTVKYRLQIVRKVSGYRCLEGDRAASVLVALRLRSLLTEPKPPPIRLVGGQAPGPTLRPKLVPFGGWRGSRHNAGPHRSRRET